MNRKSFPAQFKAVQEDGTFEAIVSVFGNVDAVGDRVVKGAFEKSLQQWKESGDPIPVIFSHQWDNLDAHVGEVLEAEETDRGLRIKAKLDMDEDFARRLHKKLKRRRIKEFSFAYDVVDEERVEDANELRELDVIEVGPTLKGINVETELLAVKSLQSRLNVSEDVAKETFRGMIKILLGEKAAIASHTTETSTGAWDGPANEARLSTDAGAETYRKAYAWVDPDGDPDTKAAYKFIHHEISSDGDVGAANVRACTTGIGVLNGGRGGTNIPDADRQGVYNHVAKHLRDADVEPPELKEVDPDPDAKGLEYIDDLVGSDEERRGLVLRALRARYENSEQWVFIVATYSDRVIAGVESRDGTTYFEMPYSIDGTEAVLGDAIEIEIRSAVIEKSAHLLARETGRVLSAKNLKAFRQAYDLIGNVLSQLEEASSGEAGGPKADEPGGEGQKTEEPPEKVESVISPLAVLLEAELADA